MVVLSDQSSPVPDEVAVSVRLGLAQVRVWVEGPPMESVGAVVTVRLKAVEVSVLAPVMTTE